jgi:hypothetical protein
MGVRRMVPGGMPTKWNSLVVFTASKIPVGGPKWRITSLSPGPVANASPESAIEAPE